MEEVLELANEECNTSPAAQDLSAALEQPITMRSFVVVEGEDELRRIMAAPLEKWRVFLHPAQRNLTQKNYSGPVRVLGGAGTGKTVVALHRAKYLASQCTGQQRILLRPIRRTSPQIFRKISARSARSRNYAKLKSFILTHGSAALCASPAFLSRSATMTPWLLYGKRRSFLQTRNCLTTFLFYQEEWNRVVISQEAITRDQYLKASRNGRGTRLDRRKRLLVWQVLDNYQNLMKEHQIRDINTAMYECTKLLQGSSVKSQYAHIIVDEGQDLSDNAYRLIRALAGPEHANDLFIVGDAHQRIYRNRLSYRNAVSMSRPKQYFKDQLSHHRGDSA